MPSHCQEGRDTNRKTHYEAHAQTTTHKTPTTHTHTHTLLEADAVLISVTVAEPLAEQFTAGAQTMEEKGCLHKGEHRNKGMQTSPGMNKQNVQHDRENHEHTQTRNWPTNTASIKKTNFTFKFFKIK